MTVASEARDDVGWVKEMVGDVLLGKMLCFQMYNAMCCVVRGVVLC